MSATTQAPRTESGTSSTTVPAPAYAPSPCYPEPEGTPAHLPEGARSSRLSETLRFLRDPFDFTLTDQGRYGGVWSMSLLTNRSTFLATSHPDHIRSIFTAKPEDAPAINHESPLRLLLGKNSVLTLSGPRHMQQRKLLLPPFHGDAIANYMQMIEEVTARELDRWEPGSSFALAPRMQAVTLEVIMRGVLGIDPDHETRAERRFRELIRTFLYLSTLPLYPLVELTNFRSAEPHGPIKWMMDLTDRELYRIIRERRAEGDGARRNDVFSLLLAARDEQGNPMSDVELRDELMTLILAGHETTANSLAWTFERLIRHPETYATLNDTVRGEDPARARAYVEATIHEGMRVRPVIAFVVRRVQRPWRFGAFVAPAQTPVALSIVGVHHRPDVYADPFTFRPERFLDADGAFEKPGTYTWIPFGGGIRRCLGATLAMAEQRVVLEQIARRVTFATTDAPGERARQRNVTSIPADGGLVTVVNRD